MTSHGRRKDIEIKLIYSPGQESRVLHHPGASFFVDFIYLEKCQKSVFPRLFLIFRDK